MRRAYALLGLSFLLVFGGAYFLIHNKAEAPTPSDTPDVSLADNDTNNMALKLSSAAFLDDGKIPEKYTCDGENINPPISISGVSEGTISLVLVMDDPDIPEAIKESRGIEKINHWVMYMLPRETTEISEGATDVVMGLNSRGEAKYTGPCPPKEYEPTEHRYFFRLYALSGTLNFIKAPTLDEVETALSGIIIEKAELMGRYERK